MKIVIVRQQSDVKQTLGTLYAYSDNGVLLFKCVTLELPDRNNERQKSSIPVGVYNVKLHWSLKFGDCISVENVPNRFNILIHAGNYYTQTEGCILVGMKHTDINNDGYKDVTTSKQTLNNLLRFFTPVNTLCVI